MRIFRLIGYFIFFTWIVFISVSNASSNLVPNPGFEVDANKDGVPDFWGIEKNKNFQVRLEEKGKNGKCISMLGKGILYCKINSIVKNKYYLLYFWIKRQNWREGEYPIIRIFNRDVYLNYIIGWGDWIKVTLLFNSKKDSKTTLYFINPGLHGKIYVDDVSLIEFTPQPKSPSHEIYTSFPEFSWWLPKNPYILEAEIQISRYSSFKKVFTVKRIIAPKGNKITSDFPIDAGRWFWRVKIYKNRRLITISKPLSFDILPFFPIGIYAVPLRYIATVKKAGFNSICINGYQNILYIIKNYNIKVLPYISSFNNNCCEFIHNMRYSNNILAWYIKDEPEINMISPLFLWRLKSYIKSIDPYHPTLITLVRANMVKDYGDAADIIMVDPYPIPRRPVTWLSNSIDMVKTLFPYKPVWAVIQAFDWSAFPYGEEKRIWGRDPTYNEERCLTYLSIIHGARGLFYYTFKTKNYFIMDRHKHWNEVKSIIKELNSIYPLLISPKIYPDDSVAKASNGAIHYIIKHVPKGFDFKSGYYVIAVNTLPTYINSHIYLPVKNISSAEDILEKRKISIYSSGLLDDFSPYQIHIYYLTN